MDYSAGLRGCWLIPFVRLLDKTLSRSLQPQAEKRLLSRVGFYTLTYKYRRPGHVVWGLILAHYHGLEVKGGAPVWVYFMFYPLDFIYIFILLLIINLEMGGGGRQETGRA